MGWGSLSGIHPDSFLDTLGSGQPWSLSLLNNTSPHYINLLKVSGHSLYRHLIPSSQQPWEVCRAGIFIPILQMMKLIASEWKGQHSNPEPGFHTPSLSPHPETGPMLPLQSIPGPGSVFLWRMGKNVVHSMLQIMVSLTPTPVK